MDFSNLWKHCYTFTHASFRTAYIYTWLTEVTAISSVTVSLHYLPRCLCSTVTCGAPMISNKPKLHTKINPYSYNKNRTGASGGQGCPSPRLKYVPPISCLSPRLLHTSILYFKNVAPLWFLFPLLRNPGDRSG